MTCSVNSLETCLTLDVFSQDQNVGIQSSESSKEPCVDLPGNQQMEQDLEHSYSLIKSDSKNLSLPPQWWWIVVRLSSTATTTKVERRLRDHPGLTELFSRRTPDLPSFSVTLNQQHVNKD